jgi:probable HAF family extracellular repeat protein
MVLVHWKINWQIYLTAVAVILSSAASGSEYMITELTLGGKYTFANDLNNLGQVVGAAYTSSGNARAFVTDPHGQGIRALGTFTGGNISGARAINERGQVVGEAEFNGYPHAFITAENDDELIDLGTFGGDYSLGMGLNDYGQVVVSSITLGSPPDLLRIL